MKLVSGGLAKEESAIYVLFGNGPRDRRILGAIAEKMDHRVVLKAPSIPRETGLDGLARMLRICIERTRVRAYLLAIDIEHLPPTPVKDTLNTVANAFSRYGLSIQGVETLNSYAHILRVVLGHREARVYLAINGLRSNGIEENLAKLIEIRYGDAPRTSDVDSWLRKHGKHDRELIEETGIEELEQAFPGIAAALRALKRGRG
ncbi:MAG: hypothetical protein DRO39_09540 [Thermoprotei archaeon]|nr:MAG: hypothetical protein DRO39_09540 [Thermoprotei archaeon]